MKLKKTGDQTLFIDQTKLFKPLIESQKESSKAIENKIATNQDVLSNTLVPFTRELQKRNEQLEALQNLPLYNAPLEIENVFQSTPQSTPQKDPTIYIDLDLDGELLNETHSENLQDMKLDLPSVVQKTGSYEDTLQKIESKNRSIGKYLGKSSRRSKEEKEVYESQKQTLKLYKQKIKALEEGAKQFIVKKTGEGLRKHKLVKLKRGKGRPRKYPDTLFYNNPDELLVKLDENHTAKTAGNTGLDNIINSILDELLSKKYIDKKEYDKLFKTIFTNTK